MGSHKCIAVCIGIVADEYVTAGDFFIWDQDVFGFWKKNSGSLVYYILTLIEQGYGKKVNV